jgi:hypothetical protein
MIIVVLCIRGVGCRRIRLLPMGPKGCGAATWIPEASVASTVCLFAAEPIYLMPEDTCGIHLFTCCDCCIREKNNIE